MSQQDATYLQQQRARKLHQNVPRPPMRVVTTTSRPVAVRDMPNSSEGARAQKGRTADQISPSRGAPHSAESRRLQSEAEVGKHASVSGMWQLVPNDAAQLVGELVAADTSAEAPREDADREAYATLVADMVTNADHFKSPALLCDTVMHQAAQMRKAAVPAYALRPYLNQGLAKTQQQAEAMLAKDMQQYPQPLVDPVRAAAACWSLDILARNSACQDALEQIRDTLFPCLFLDYPTGMLPSRRRGRFTQDQLRSNPYLETDFVFEHFHEARSHIEELRGAKASLDGRVGETVSGFRTIVARLNRRTVPLIFRAWRMWVRKSRVDRFSRDLLRRHGHRETRRHILEGSLARWRLVVEQNRSSDLRQRAHALEHQLENTKNQFQLQCFRSDKYLRLVEELREELASTRQQRDDLMKEVRELRRDLQRHQDKSKDQLNRYVSVLMEELGRWRRFVRRRVESDNAKAESLTFATSGQGVAADAEDAGEDMDTGTDNTTSEIESQLLQWCSGVLSQSVVSAVQRVTNWTSDWYSGEVLLILLHYVFPTQVPLGPLQETNVPRRLEQICESAKKAGIAHLPRPNDIMEGAGDLIILVAAELYSKFTAQARVRETALQLEPLEHRLVVPEGAPPPAYDAEMLPSILDDSAKELARLVEMDGESVNKDRHVWRTQEILNGYTSYITRERMEGRAVVVVDKKDVARYCRFNKNRFVDIATKFRGPPLEYQGIWHSFDQQLDALRFTLQKHYQDLRRIFVYYCRGKSMMTEADFWRFVADVRVLDRTVTRGHVDRIFAISNNETPPIAKIGKKGAANSTTAADYYLSSSSDEDENMDNDGEEPDPDDEENSETELIPSEFIECIIRIADRKFPGKMIHERVQHFLSVHVVPYACKSDTDKFKKEIHSAQTESAVQKYQRDLVKVFGHFAKGRGRGKKRGKTMLLPDFLFFLKESMIMSQALDESAGTSVFGTVSTSAEETNKEIDHREFLEAVVCLSVFKVPSPFIPLDKKVEAISSSIVSNLRPKLKPTVVLSDLPLVTLRQT